MPRTEDAFGQFVSKKAYEICYALFRVASQVKHPNFADRLEGQGLDLLESAVNNDYRAVSVAVRAVEYLLRIGADVNIVNQSNAQVIIYELGQFDSAIAELDKPAEVLPVNLDNIFSQLPVLAENPRMSRSVINNEGKIEGTAQNQSQNEPKPFDAKEQNNGNGNGNNNHGNGIVKAAMRKSTILEIIRQNGNCHLKEIQDTLPNVSERTVRYDIQNLIEQGLVERLGNGGPATYYRNRT